MSLLQEIIVAQDAALWFARATGGIQKSTFGVGIGSRLLDRFAKVEGANGVTAHHWNIKLVAATDVGKSLQVLCKRANRDSFAMFQIVGYFLIGHFMVDRDDGQPKRIQGEPVDQKFGTVFANQGNPPGNTGALPKRRYLVNGSVQLAVSQ